TGAPTPFRLEVPSAPENPVFPPRALHWGVDEVLAGATVIPFPGSTTFSTVLIEDPRFPAQGSSRATFAVQHDWYLSGGLGTCVAGSPWPRPSPCTGISSTWAARSEGLSLLHAGRSRRSIGTAG